MDRSGGFSGGAGAGGPPGSQQGNSQKKLQQTQAQVDEVRSIRYNQRLAYAEFLVVIILHHL